MCHFTNYGLLYIQDASELMAGIWKMRLRCDFAYHIVFMSLSRAVRYIKFSMTRVTKIPARYFRIQVKKMNLSFFYNANFVSINGKIYYPFHMFVDLMAGPV